MDYLELASLVGTFAFALSGALLGIYKNLDVMGVFILAFLTCSGGGAIRDIFLNTVPAILTNTTPFIICFAIIGCIKILKINHKQHRIEEKKLFTLSDTIGLSAFAISGALQAVSLELSLFGVLTITFLTAVGGGIIRDILVNEVPNILKSGFYGTTTIIIGLSIFALDFLALNLNMMLPIIFILGTMLGLYTQTNKTNLPRL